MALQFLRPAPATSNSGWSGFPSSSFNSNINEVTPDDNASYISTSLGIIGSQVIVFPFTGSITDPNVLTEHKLVVRFSGIQTLSGGSVFSNTSSIRATLQNSGSDIFGASFLMFETLGGSIGSSYQTITALISSSIIASLSGDYSNLGIKLELSFTVTPVATTAIRITQVYLEVPEVVVDPPFVFSHTMEGGSVGAGGAVISDVTADIIKVMDGGCITSGEAIVNAILAFTDVFDAFYGITVENPARDTLAFLSNFKSASWTREANKFSTLNFQIGIDGNEGALELVDFPNLLVVKDKQGRVLDRLVIAKNIETDGDTNIRRVQAFGLFSLLSKTNIPSFSSNGETTLFLIVKFLLENFQVTDAPHPITLGKIDIDISDQLKTVEFSQLSITEALLSLYKTTGGVIEVDGNGILNWRGSNFDTAPNHRISEQTNLKSIQKTDHHDLVRTSVTVQSEDVDGNPITATALLGAGPILTKYGVVPEFIFDNTIKTVENAQDLADSWLDRLSVLPTDLTATVLDLNRSDFSSKNNTPFQSYSLNDTVRVIHPRLGDLGIKLITKITVNLEDSSKNVLEFSDPVDTDFRQTSRNLNIAASITGNTATIKNIGVTS